MRAFALALASLTALTLATGPAQAATSGGEGEAGSKDEPQGNVEEPQAEAPEAKGAKAKSKADDEHAHEGDEVEGDPHEALVAAKKKKKKKKSKKRKAKAPKRPPGAEECDFVTPLHFHEVAAGEHLGLIAGQYGVRSQDIIALNPKLAKNPSHIRVGQKLAVCPEIPPREHVEIEHVVAKGQTFGQIAASYELSVDELLALQDGAVTDPNRIRVGQRLRVAYEGEIVRGFEPEPPQPGRLLHGRKLPERDSYYIKRPHNVWGTPRTIRLITQVVAAYERRANGGPQLRIGDISKQHGGPMQGHLSHQEGVDIDVGVVLKGKLADRKHFSGATEKNIDLQRTWILIEEFLATGEVRYIFLDYKFQKQLYEYAKSQGVSEQKLDEYFQYPRGIGRNHGIIRHWRGHVNHLHVRFKG
ncbi:LysM domain protein [Plesiocystis pacifica SIR-1]|uniref:LysM domain protein n=1 Tax=Plesiocystis pacifica SIR-1 TaxID=391625 RepID=A6GFI1_9BACT|nr:LysM domain-containing protein [Plesiocystis pacifica]EDM75353.1 LysM domain protein [Plesiocystis pacifica SIR-1]